MYMVPQRWLVTLSLPLRPRRGEGLDFGGLVLLFLCPPRQYNPHEVRVHQALDLFRLRGLDVDGDLGERRITRVWAQGHYRELLHVSRRSNSGMSE